MTYNPYSVPVRDLFRRLVLLAGTVQHFDLHLRRSTDTISQGLRSGKGLETATNLVIRDLTEWHADGWSRCYSGGAHARTGRQFLSVLRELEYVGSGWAVSQGFEEFERMLKRQVSRYLKKHPAACQSPTWKPSKSCPSVFQARMSLSQFEAAVRASFRGVEDLLPRLRRSIPALRNAETRNNRALDLASWLKAASEVRHAHVHTSGCILSKRISALSKGQQALLVANFPGRIIRNDYALMVSAERATKVLERYAEYGNLIAKVMSEADSLTWQMPWGGRV